LGVLETYLKESCCIVSPFIFVGSVLTTCSLKVNLPVFVQRNSDVGAFPPCLWHTEHMVVSSLSFSLLFFYFSQVNVNVLFLLNDVVPGQNKRRLPDKKLNL